MAFEPKVDWAAGDQFTAVAANRIEQGVADSAPAEHSHAAGDVTSGTFAVARIPSLAQSKITGLVDALDGKAGTEDIPAPQFTEDEVAALKALVADAGA